MSPQSTSSDTAKRDKLWANHKRNLTKLTRQHPLRYLFLEVTRRCNLACAYCGSDCTTRERDAELSASEWIGVVSQIAEDFTPSDVMIAVTGGEPLMKPGVFDLFRELKRKGFSYGMVSNGQLITLKMAHDLIQAGMGSISISMDAPVEVNDALRGRGVTDKAMSAVRALQEAGFAGKLEIISTLTTPAVGLLDEMRHMVGTMRVPFWRLAPVMPIGRAAQRPDLVPGPAEVRRILEFIKAAREDKLLPSPEFCEEGFLGNRFEGFVRPFLSQCRAGITTGGILCDGRIGACPELGDAFVQGDIRTERFKHVWETRYQSLRDRSWTRRGPCKACDHFDRCQGGSLHLYKDTQTDILRCLYDMAKQGGG